MLKSYMLLYNFPTAHESDTVIAQLSALGSYTPILVFVNQVCMSNDRSIMMQIFL